MYRYISHKYTIRVKPAKTIRSFSNFERTNDVQAVSVALVLCHECANRVLCENINIYVNIGNDLQPCRYLRGVSVT